jgi:hypothetical protein
MFEGANHLRALLLGRRMKPAVNLKITCAQKQAFFAITDISFIPIRSCFAFCGLCHLGHLGALLVSRCSSGLPVFPPPPTTNQHQPPQLLVLVPPHRVHLTPQPHDHRIHLSIQLNTFKHSNTQTHPVASIILQGDNNLPPTHNTPRLRTGSTRASSRARTPGHQTA